MTITADMTFRKPLPKDYGMEIQAKARTSRNKTTPPVKKPYTAIELTASAIGKDQQIKRLHEMQDRALLVETANREWATFSLTRRVILRACGFNPISYYEVKA